MSQKSSILSDDNLDNGTDINAGSGSAEGTVSTEASYVSDDSLERATDIDGSGVDESTRASNPHPEASLA